jgi:hypothetical protein
VVPYKLHTLVILCPNYKEKLEIYFSPLFPIMKFMCSLEKSFNCFHISNAGTIYKVTHPFVFSVKGLISSKHSSSYILFKYLLVLSNLRRHKLAANNFWVTLVSIFASFHKTNFIFMSGRIEVPMIMNHTMGNVTLGA